MAQICSGSLPSLTLGNITLSSPIPSITSSDAATPLVISSNNGIQLVTTNGFKLTDSSIHYPSVYNTTGALLPTNSSYAQTYNGSTLTATLPVVSSTNVGVQFLITNTNASALTVIGDGVQLIYSSTGAASATSRSLAVGHSQIFTAIRTTGATTYGWSMV